MSNSLITALWSAFDDCPDDLGRLLILADAYREAGLDQFADCLAWCYAHGRKPYKYNLGLENYFWGWIGSWGYGKRENMLPPDFDKLIGSSPDADCSGDTHEYLRGHQLPSGAYQFLCRLWTKIGGVQPR